MGIIYIKIRQCFVRKMHNRSGGKMEHEDAGSQIKKLVEVNAGDILCSSGMQSEKQYIQHGEVNCYDHSVAVAYTSVAIAFRLRFNVDMQSMVRGALLHDYFLYDWHDPDKGHRFHGFIHAGRALENAERDFVLSDIERDIISKHMFPMNPKPPRYVESIVVTLADKICTLHEILPFALLSKHTKTLK